MIFTTVVALASVAASVNAGTMHVRRTTHTYPVPSTYDAAHLESYQAYHTRYLALNCANQHNTTFFDTCCHPMLNTETLQTARPQQCWATGTSSAAPAASSAADDEGDDCEDDGADEPSSAAKPAATKPASTIGDGVGNAESAPDSSSPAPAASSAAPAAPAPPPPAPTSTKASSSAKPAATSSPASNSPLSSLFNAFSTTGSLHQGGIGTFFFQNGVAGNCGTVHQDSDLVIALPTTTYAGGSLCGKKIVIADTKSGVTAIGTVADSCPTCDNNECLDLSVALFEKFASQGAGVFNLAWKLLDD